LTKQEKWYQIPSKKMLFRLQVGDEIDPCEHGGSDKRSIAARRLTEYLEQYFVATRHQGQATE
jgi:hypothetical protein